jgi:hypothetical protein
VIVKPGCFFTSRAGTPYTMTAGPEGVTYIETWGVPVTKLKTVWYDFGWVRRALSPGTTPYPGCLPSADGTPAPDGEA